MKGWFAVVAIAGSALLAGCGEKDEPVLQSGDRVPSEERRLARRLSGTIQIDGPRVLQPLFSAADRNFEVETPVQVEVEESGTETAFDKLCTGRLDVAGARRKMTGVEAAACRDRGIGVQSLKIANHAVGIAVSEPLDIACLTIEQLQILWRPGSRVSRYSQLGPGFPPAKVELYGPRTANDSFELFTSLVNGRQGAIRDEWQAVVNRGAMTGRLRDSSRALGLFNFAQLTPLPDSRLLAVDGGDGCVKPTEASVQSGRYPLQEDLYVYVSESRLENLRLRSFLQYVLGSYSQLAATAPSVVPATDQEIADARRALPEAEAPSG